MKSVVLLSGGIDSLVCAEMLRQSDELVGCVFIDYGHPAQVQEGWKAFAYCGSRGVPLKVVHAFGLDLGDMASESGARVVPHRNAVFLAIAANAARGMGATGVVIGANADDARDYEDCRGAFLRKVAEMLDMRVNAPLLHFRKRLVIEKAVELGLAKSDAWGCYKGGKAECGDCPSCAESADAWGAVGDASVGCVSEPPPVEHLVLEAARIAHSAAVSEWQPGARAAGWSDEYKVRHPRPRLLDFIKVEQSK